MRLLITPKSNRSCFSFTSWYIYRSFQQSRHIACSVWIPTRPVRNLNRQLFVFLFNGWSIHSPKLISNISPPKHWFVNVLGCRKSINKSTQNVNAVASLHWLLYHRESSLQLWSGFGSMSLCWLSASPNSAITHFSASGTDWQTFESGLNRNLAGQDSHATDAVQKRKDCS